MKYTKFPIVKLPDNMQFCLCLIKEELKCRKLFQALHEAGIDDCYFQPHLESLILLNVGLDDGTDETYRVCNEILDRRSRKIKADIDSITKHALKAYQELKSEKRKRRKNAA